MLDLHHPSPLRRVGRAGSLLAVALLLTPALGAAEPAALPSPTAAPTVVRVKAHAESTGAAVTVRPAHLPDERLESCREIILRASLQPLTPEDAATLRRTCR